MILQENECVCAHVHACTNSDINISVKENINKREEENRFFANMFHSLKNLIKANVKILFSCLYLYTEEI